MVIFYPLSNGTDHQAAIVLQDFPVLGSEAEIEVQIAAGTAAALVSNLADCSLECAARLVDGGAPAALTRLLQMQTVRHALDFCHCYFELSTTAEP